MKREKKSLNFQEKDNHIPQTIPGVIVKIWICSKSLCLKCGSQISNEAVKPLKHPQTGQFHSKEAGTGLRMIQSCGKFFSFMNFIFVFVVNHILKVCLKIGIATIEQNELG